jgi:hypothetical protein
MGCVHYKNIISQSEVITDVDKIREAEKFPQININHNTNFMNETINIDIISLANEKSKSHILCSGTIVKTSNKSIQPIKEEIIFESQEGIITKATNVNKELNDSREIGNYSIGSKDSFERKKSIKHFMIKQRNAKIFGDKILTQFNSARTNPLAYADKLESLIKFIKPNGNELKNKYKEAYKFVLEYSEKKMIGLPSGEEGFKKAIEYLRSCKPICELQWNDEIYIDYNIDDTETFDSQIKEKICIIKKKFPLFNMHMDVVKDPELSAILQIVDDTRYDGRRRETIMNPKFNFMSLSQAKNKSKQILTLVSFS